MILNCTASVSELLVGMIPIPDFWYWSDANEYDIWIVIIRLLSVRHYQYAWYSNHGRITPNNDQCHHQVSTTSKQTLCLGGGWHLMVALMIIWSYSLHGPWLKLYSTEYRSVTSLVFLYFYCPVTQIYD